MSGAGLSLEDYGQVIFLKNMSKSSRMAAPKHGCKQGTRRETIENVSCQLAKIMHCHNAVLKSYLHRTRYPRVFQ